VIPLTPTGARATGGVSLNVRALKTVAVATLAVTATPLAVAHFAANVPSIVPSVDGWERIAGDLEFQKPRVAVQYEFFVNPARPAIYEVVRYRVTDLDPRRKGKRYPDTEKLQWDRDGRDLRRFECVEPQAATGCVWQEMEKGSDDYLREVPVLLWLYGAHHTASVNAERRAR
jgi:hypothetical protein